MSIGTPGDPNFSMPLIDIPSSVTDLPAYYATQLNNGSFQATLLTGTEGITVAIPAGGSKRIFAFADGVVRHIAAGQALYPGSTIVAQGDGAVELQISLPKFMAIKDLPGGLLPPTHIYYQNVDKDILADAGNSVCEHPSSSRCKGVISNNNTNN